MRVGNKTSRAATAFSLGTTTDFDATAASPAAATQHRRFALSRGACDADAVTHNFCATVFACLHAGRMLFGSDPAVPIL